MIFENHWAWILVACALGLVLLEVLGRKSWTWALLCRLGWILCLGFLISGLSFVKTKELSEASALHIIADVSDSVARVPDRLERLNTVLDEIQKWSVSEKIPLKFTTFGEKISNPTFETLKVGGGNSLLAPALAATPEGSRVVLLSDGLWVDAVKSNAAVIAVSLGKKSEKDVWIENAQRVYTAFLKNRLKIPFAIAHQGYSGKNIRVSLLKGTEVIDSKEVDLVDGVNPVELSLFPEKMGEESLLLSIESDSEELSDLNNRLMIRIRTVRDKMRILHVGGKPSADLKAWRSFLTRQPDIDLVSFYILRSLNDDPQARNSDLSLIPFPYDELFSTELDKFDMVILQNFDFTLYFQPFYLANLAAFVRGGGALLMIGGDQGFHRYNPSPLSPLFPFEFNRGGSFVEREGSVSFVADHPLMAGMEGALKSIRWEGYHLVDQRPGALDLAHYKTGEPFLSGWDIEEGRVLALNSDESWKLQMRPQADAAAFSRMARRILQYLTFDPEVNPTKIQSGRWIVGQPVNLKLTGGERIPWTVEPVRPGAQRSQMGPASEIQYLVDEPGWYQVDAVQKEMRIFETEEKPWLSEWKNLISREDKLQDIARSSEGQFLRFEDREKIFEPALVGKQTLSAEVTSWTRGGGYWTWIFLISSLFLLCLDFYLRKREQWDA